MTNKLITLLLRDAARLLRPLRVTQDMSSPASDTVSSAHPHIMPILVLSDLNDLFSDSRTPSKPNHIAHKIRFYAAHILSTPSAILRSLADEMNIRARDEDGGVIKVDLSGMETKKKEPKTLVEEITEREGSNREV